MQNRLSYPNVTDRVLVKPFQLLWALWREDNLHDASIMCEYNKFIGWVVSLFCTGLWRALTMIPIPTKYRGRGQVIEQVTFAASSPLNMHLLARKRWELEAIRLEGKILELLFWTKRNRKGSQLFFFHLFPIYGLC